MFFQNFSVCEQVNTPIFTGINCHFNRRYIVILQKNSVKYMRKTSFQNLKTIFIEMIYWKNILILQEKLVNYRIIFFFKITKVLIFSET